MLLKSDIIVEQIKSCFFGIPKKGIKVIWEVTKNCQLNCVHCCNNFRRNRQRNIADISLLKAKNIIKKLSQYNVNKIVFTGGDPLEYDHIFELVKCAKSFGMKVSLSTNGMLLEKYYDEIIKLSPLKIVIGIYGFLPETHDSFVGKKGALNNIFLWVEKLIPHGIEVNFHYTANKKNLHELEDLMNYANEKGIKVSLANILQVKGRPLIKKYLISEDGFENKLNRIIHKHYYNVEYIRNKKGILEKCPAGDKVIGILFNGKFTPCPWISNFSSKYDTDSVEKVFKYKKSIETILKNNLCINCSISKCGRGCPGSALSIKSNFDPLCLKR